MSDSIASKLKSVNEIELLQAILIKLCGDEASANEHLKQVQATLNPPKELPSFSLPNMSR